jgi:tetratricopeptide (TPR) repeat protein
MRAFPIVSVGLLGALLCGVAAQPASAQSLPRIFTAANEAYFQDDLEGAISGYRQLIEAGVDDADVYFNLATAHARRNELGHAILYFERALWLRPGDAGIEEGLATTRRLLGKQRAEREGEATVRTRPPITEALAGPFTADALAWLLLALDVLVFGLLLVRRRLPGETARLAVTVAIPIAALIGLATAGLLAVKLDAFEDGERAIVLTDGAPLREGPDARAKVRQEARQGQRARVLAGEHGYLRVRLPGGSSGWMKDNDLGLIRPN